MKKMIKILVLTLLVITPFSLQSCDNDGYSLGDFAVSYATVKRATNTYYLKLDSGAKLWVSAGYLGYNGLDGQRVIANYTILSDGNGEFDYYVKVNGLDELLTKNIEQVKSEKDDADFGNDNLYGLNDIWFGGGYVNVDFSYVLPKTAQKHRISLVENMLKESPEDGYMYLELRYNTYDNLSSYYSRGIACFSTQSVELDGKKGFKVMWKDRDGKEQIATLDFSNKKKISPNEDYQSAGLASIK